MNRKYPRHKERPISSENSPVESSSSASGIQVLSNVPLPAFVLNPDGTHYFPICIHLSFLDNIICKKKVGKHSISHPISIPVNFDGPYIAMSHSPLSQSCGSTEWSGGTDIIPCNSRDKMNAMGVVWHLRSNALVPRRVNTTGNGILLKSTQKHFEWECFLKSLLHNWKRCSTLYSLHFCRHMFLVVTRPKYPKIANYLRKSHWCRW